MAWKKLNDWAITNGKYTITKGSVHGEPRYMIYQCPDILIPGYYLSAKDAKDAINKLY